MSISAYNALCIIMQERVSNVVYNILNREYSSVKNLSAPVYITIGDGGNVEGLQTCENKFKY